MVVSSAGFTGFGVTAGATGVAVGATVAACERGIVLHDGRIAESGPLEGLAYFRSMAGDPDE